MARNIARADASVKAAGTVRSLFGPVVELVKSWSRPGRLVHWGHPGNMGNPGLRNIHGILGSGIMTLFLLHAALGLQLGLSY